jgi:hypothetical protein
MRIAGLSDADLHSRADPVRQRIWLACIWSWPACLIIFGICLVVVTAFFPPAAYMNNWVAVIGAGGALAVYVKTGPFSWNDIIGSWLPVPLFVIGITLNTWLLHRHATYEATTARVA